MHCARAASLSILLSKPSQSTTGAHKEKAVRALPGCDSSALLPASVPRNDCHQQGLIWNAETSIIKLQARRVF